jgi:hypothetical protein
VALYTNRPYPGPDLLVKRLEKKQSRYIADSRVDEENDRELCKEFGIITQYVIPLFTPTMLIGTLSILMGELNEEPKDELRVLDALGAHLSITIERHRTLERLYADRMVLSDLLIEAMEKRAEQGILDADVVDQIGRDLPEKIVTLKGYVHDIRGAYVEVVVDQIGPDEKREPKRLLMHAETFERQGLLVRDMAFVYRLYWQGGRMISEVARDERRGVKKAATIEEELKKMKEIARKKAGRTRDGGNGD